MKRFIIALMVLGFAFTATAADVTHVRQTIVLADKTDDGHSDTILLKSAKNLPKQLYIELLGTAANIRLQIQVGDVVAGDNKWVTTFDMTVTESGGTWTMTPVGGAAQTVTMPFLAVTTLSFKQLRIQYTTTSGEIEDIVLTTDN